jgi:hypothetical protein
MTSQLDGGERSSFTSRPPYSRERALWGIETSFPFNSLTYDPWLHSVCSTGRCVLFARQERRYPRNWITFIEGSLPENVLLNEGSLPGKVLCIKHCIWIFFEILLSVVNTKWPTVKRFVQHLCYSYVELQSRCWIIKWRRKNTPRHLISWQAPRRLSVALEPAWTLWKEYRTVCTKYLREVRHNVSKQPYERKFLYLQSPISRVWFLSCAQNCINFLMTTQVFTPVSDYDATWNADMPMGPSTCGTVQIFGDGTNRSKLHSRRN